MEDYGDIVLGRIKKLEGLREKGVNPYPNDIRVSHSVGDVRSAFGALSGEELEKRGEHVSVAGRVMAIRKFGKASFVVIEDKSGKIQLFLRKDALGETFDLFREFFDIGDIFWAKGILFRTKTGELTVQVEELRLVTKSLRPLPEKWHGLSDVETRYRQRYLDLIVNRDVRETFILRANIVSFIRRFLIHRGFMEVETPMMHSIPGGAAARPFVTHHNSLDMELYLRIAPELYLKRLLVGGFERVFEINRNFRNEGISTQHNPELTMLEFYQAYASFKDLMDLTEATLSSLVKEVKGAMKVPYQGKEIDFTPPWKRMTMKEGISAHLGVKENDLETREGLLSLGKDLCLDLDPSLSVGKLMVEIFEDAVESTLEGPVFVYEYPLEVSPLSRKNEKNNLFVDRFELYISGREIANAFSELNDPLDQKERFLMQLEERRKGDEEAHRMDEDYIRALEYGMPPAAGEGIGIDRLVMLLADAPSIRDVILFPLLRPLKGR